MNKIANNEFNKYVKQNGAFDTNRNTYRMNDLLQSYKSTSKEQYNTFKKNNRITLWDTVVQTANDLGKATENTWLGFQNGVKNFQQTLGRRITETQAERQEFWDKQQKEMLENRMNQHPEEAKEIQRYIDNMDNRLGSGKQIREEAEETTQKIQNEKGNNAKAAGEKFLAENKTKEGVHTLKSGLQYKVLIIL